MLRLYLLHCQLTDLSSLWLRSKGTGFDHGEALHYPLEQGMWKFSRSPGNEPDPNLRGADSSRSLDLIVPQLAVRSNVVDPVPEPLADGIWSVY